MSGKDGFPRTGEVIKYYRERKMDHEGHPYTQSDLAQILGISEQAIRDLENKDTSMDDSNRRQFLSKLLAIPPILLGIITLNEIDKLVEQRRAAQSVMTIVSTEVSTSHRRIIDLGEYAALLEGYWTTYLSNPTQISITNIDLCIDALNRELPRVREKKPLQELLCRFHDLAATILCDVQKYNAAMVHLEKASWFAQLLNSDELKALVLYNYGYALWWANRIHEALEKYKEARRYEQRLPTNLRGALLLETGCVEALDAETPEKKRTAIVLVDRVGTIVRSGRIEEDPYFLDLNLDRYHLTRSASLVAVGQNKEAIDELELVKVGSERPRIQAYKDIFRAQAHANLGEYSEAACFATSGLVIFQEANSVRNIALVERLFQKLEKSPYQNSPDVAHLDYLLHYKQREK